MNSEQAVSLRNSETKMLITAVKSMSGLRWFLYDYLQVISMKSCGETPPLCTACAGKKFRVLSWVTTSS